MASSTTLRAAAVQLNATEDVDRNLETADRLTRRAARDGAQTAVVIVIGVAAQLAWLALFGYAVYRFV